MLTVNKKKTINKNSISYTVHPVPGPFSTKALNNNNKSDGGRSQKETLFKRGNQKKYK